MQTCFYTFQERRENFDEIAQLFVARDGSDFSFRSLMTESSCKVFITSRELLICVWQAGHGQLYHFPEAIFRDNLKFDRYLIDKLIPLEALVIGSLLPFISLAARRLDVHSQQFDQFVKYNSFHSLLFRNYLCAVAYHL